MATIHITRGTTGLGTFSEEEVREGLRTGRFISTDLGWREGMSAEEAQHWFEEARRLALAAGNMRANAWAHASFGRNLAVNGSADEYVLRVREALALAIDAKAKAGPAPIVSRLLRFQ